MKNGKRPNKRQKIAMREANLNPDVWLVVKNFHDELHLINRDSEEARVIKIG